MEITHAIHCISSSPQLTALATPWVDSLKSTLCLAYAVNEQLISIILVVFLETSRLVLRYGEENLVRCRLGRYYGSGRWNYHRIANACSMLCLSMSGLERGTLILTVVVNSIETTRPERGAKPQEPQLDQRPCKCRHPLATDIETNNSLHRMPKTQGTQHIYEEARSS